jgi:hypothetical protein
MLGVGGLPLMAMRIAIWDKYLDSVMAIRVEMVDLLVLSEWLGSGTG